MYFDHPEKDETKHHTQIVLPVFIQPFDHSCSIDVPP